MKTKRSNDKMKVGFYAVCFIDLLGQRDRLSALHDLPDQADKEQMEVFFHNLGETYGVVSRNRKLFRHFFNSFSAPRQTDLSGLTSEQQALYKQMTNNPIRLMPLSDSIIAFTSLATDINKVPMRAIYGMFVAASSVALLSLSVGTPVRGGIDIGIGMEIEEGEIYGPCLARAYTLESSLAQYPRILVGSECLDYLQLSLRKKPEDIFDQITIDTARVCHGLLMIDDDGCAALDYLGANYRSTIADLMEKTTVKEAYDNVVKFSEVFRQNNDTKNALRLTLLRNYFERRFEDWKLDA